MHFNPSLSSLDTFTFSRGDGLLKYRHKSKHLVPSDVGGGQSADHSLFFKEGKKKSNAEAVASPPLHHPEREKFRFMSERLGDYRRAHCAPVDFLFYYCPRWRHLDKVWIRRQVVGKSPFTFRPTGVET